MSPQARVTVTLPKALVEEIDRQAKNRSRFVHEAVRRELDRRRREELARSLEDPHPDTEVLAEEGFDEWARRLPDEVASSLVDPGAGTAVVWVPGQGWIEKAG